VASQVGHDSNNHLQRQTMCWEVYALIYPNIR